MERREYMLDAIVWYTFDDAPAVFASPVQDLLYILILMLVCSTGSFTPIWRTSLAGRPFFIKHLAWLDSHFLVPLLSLYS